MPLSSWVAELLRLLGGLAAAYLPGSGGVDARTRERIIVSMAEVGGSPVTAWVHASWLEFLGDREPDELLLPLLDYAASCAEAGRPLDTTTLDAVYPSTLVSSVRATVARTVVVQSAEQAARDLVSVGWRSPARRLRDLAVTALAAPVVAPMLATATAMRVTSWLAPPLPRIELPADEDANLVVHLLAEASPTYLAHTLLRTGVVLSPVTLALGVRMEGATATLRAGRGRITVSEGIHPDVLLVLQGGTEPLLRLVASSIASEISRPRTLRRRS